MLVIENNLISDDIENSYILTNTFNQEGARSIHWKSQNIIKETKQAEVNGELFCVQGWEEFVWQNAHNSHGNLNIQSTSNQSWSDKIQRHRNNSKIPVGTLRTEQRI